MDLSRNSINEIIIKIEKLEIYKQLYRHNLYDVHIDNIYEIILEATK
jgi:hypothetical protein